MNIDKLGNQIEYIKQEVSILSKIDHPCIVKYYETYEDKKKLFLVMEYIDGEEILEKLQSNQDSTLTEAQARDYIL